MSKETTADMANFTIYQHNFTLLHTLEDEAITQHSFNDDMSMEQLDALYDALYPSQQQTLLAHINFFLETLLLPLEEDSESTNAYYASLSIRSK